MSIFACGGIVVLSVRKSGAIHPEEGEFMFCIKCGAEIQEGTAFCIHCGTPVAANPASESPKAESPEKENPKAESPESETPKTEIPESESSRSEIPESESLRPEIPGETPPRAESSESDSIVIKIPKIKIPKVDNPAISETGEKVKEMGKKYLKEGVESVQKAYQYGSEQIKSGSITIPRPKLSKKKLSMIGGIALLIVVIFVLSSLFKGSGSGFRSPEKAYDAWNRGYYQHDFDLALKAWPDFDIEYRGGEAKVRAQLQSWYDDEGLAELQFAYRYKAVDHTNLSKSKVEELSQKMTDFYGRDIKISDAATIERQFIVITDGKESDSRKETDEEEYGYAIKYKGKWYYFALF